MCRSIISCAVTPFPRVPAPLHPCLQHYVFAFEVNFSVLLFNFTIASSYLPVPELICMGIISKILGFSNWIIWDAEANRACWKSRNSDSWRSCFKMAQLKNFERQRNDLRIVAWKLFSVEKLKRLLYRNCSENFFYWITLFLDQGCVLSQPVDFFCLFWSETAKLILYLLVLSILHHADWRRLVVHKAFAITVKY